MKLDFNKNITIVGLGLIGGSYARALSALGYTVTAIDRNADSIAYAISEGMITRGATEADAAILAEADVIVFALYPSIFVPWVEENQKKFKSGAIMTDVTGVKGCVVERIQAILRPDVEFIAAHPMAGREVSGVRNSDPSIFRAANYVVTPTPRNTEDAIELCCHLGKVLGFARVSVLSVDDHDEIIAFVSQLTHCIAICLMTCQETEHLEDYTGDSFRDLTRIARLNDEMWSELFLSNKEALLSQMSLFERELSLLREKLEAGDREGLREMMRASTARRALFDKKPIV